MDSKLENKFISIETAIQLMKTGIIIESYYYFDFETMLYRENSVSEYAIEQFRKHMAVLTPEKTKLQEFLREKHDIHVVVLPVERTDQKPAYQYQVYHHAKLVNSQQLNSLYDFVFDRGLIVALELISSFTMKVKSLTRAQCEVEKQYTFIVGDVEDEFLDKNKVFTTIEETIVEALKNIEFGENMITILEIVKPSWKEEFIDLSGEFLDLLVEKNSNKNNDCKIIQGKFIEDVDRNQVKHALISSPNLNMILTQIFNYNKYIKVITFKVHKDE